MKNLFQKMKEKSMSMGAKVGAVGTMAMASGSAFAVDHSTAIQAAGTDGTTNTTAAAVVVIAIASVVTGIGIVLGLLRK